MKKVAAEPYRDFDFSKAVRGPIIAVEPGVSGGTNPRKYGGEDTQFRMAVSAKLPRSQPQRSVGLLRRVKGSLRRAEARP